MLQPPKTSCIRKFPCLLNLPSTNMVWLASFFGHSLPSVYGDQFVNQQLNRWLKNKTQPCFLMVLCNMQTLPKSGQLKHYCTNPGWSQKTVLTGNPPSGQDFKHHNLLFILPGRRNDQRYGSSKLMDCGSAAPTIWQRILKLQRLASSY